MSATTTKTAYKVWVIADNSGKWATNALEFDSQAEADNWGFDLSCRWFAVRDYIVYPCHQNPNVDGVESDS